MYPASTASAFSLGNYIRAGLGISKNTSSTGSNTSSTTITSLFNANSSIPRSYLLQCAASWATYDSLTSSDIIGAYTTFTTSSRSNVSLTYGTGEVYTNTLGIPVARGSFTPTKVVQTVVTIESSTSTYELITKVPLGPTPSCASLSPSDCSRLYVSYLSSLGLSEGATVPAITPAPTNSPQCPKYFYEPYSNCSYWQDPVNTCWISGENVQLFYFPPKTENFGSQGRNGTSLSYAVVQSYAPGITFTSPSIYLSFDYLSAMSTLGAEESACSSCGWNGCMAMAVGGGDAYQTMGTSISGALLTLRPDDVSTLVAPYNDAKASQAASIIAHGAAGFANIGEDLQYLFSFRAKQLELSAITRPAPTDYYLRPSGAPGCNSSYPSPECSTIFEGLYRPILSLPSQVAELQGGWKSCLPAIFGVYDPPKALTEVTTIAGVSDYSTHLSDSKNSGVKSHLRTSATLSPATGTSRLTPPCTDSSRPNTAPLPSISSPSRPQSSGPIRQSAPGTTKNSPPSTVNGLSILLSAISDIRASQTSDPKAPAPSNEDLITYGATTVTVGGHAFTVSHYAQNEIIVNGVLISKGAMPTAIESQTVLLESHVVQIGSSTITIGEYQAEPTAFAADSGAVFTLASSILTVLQDHDISDVDILDGSITLKIGGPMQTIDGVAFSAIQGGIVDDGTKIPFSVLTTTKTGLMESTATSEASNLASGLPTERISTSKSEATRSILPIKFVALSAFCIALAT
ncbi:MAG: hypothetical protein FE78DRAFT_519069 [Acidomyces sp. 'richmondensis']|nr:MAG: hypothetical protein FE78DRAFT_519069 [Acidomyces sp. 'richmondensis']